MMGKERPFSQKWKMSVCARDWDVGERQPASGILVGPRDDFSLHSPYTLPFCPPENDQRGGVNESKF